MSAASTYLTMKALGEQERANGTATVTLDEHADVEAKPAKPIGRNRAKVTTLTDAEQRKQISDGLQAAGLPAGTQLTPEQERRALAWPKGLRNGALTTYILEGKTMAEQVQEAQADRKKRERAVAQETAKAAGAKAKTNGTKPKGKWWEVNQPDVPMYEGESKKAKVDNGFAAFLIEDGKLAPTPIGIFDGSGSRPAQAVRLAISKLPGYDQAKAEQAEFVTVRVRNLRKTLPIAAEKAPAA